MLHSLTPSNTSVEGLDFLILLPPEIPVGVSRRPCIYISCGGMEIIVETGIVSYLEIFQEMGYLAHC
jgi:hypothetical protein